MIDLLSIVRPGARGLCQWRLLDADGGSITGWWSDRAPREVRPDRHYLYSPGLRTYRSNRCHGAWCVWADLDGLPRGAGLDLAVPPSAVVWSGRNGYHVYWSLRDWCPAVDLAPALVAVAHHVAGDPAAARVGQLLRWPGSVNVKPGGGLVELVELRPDVRYTLSDLLSAYPLPAVLQDPPPAAGGPRCVTAGVDSSSRFARANALLLAGGTIGDLIGSTCGRGGRGRYLCPFHADVNASISVDNSRGVWYCHACRVGGDAVEWYARLNKISKGEVLRRVLAHV